MKERAARLWAWMRYHPAGASAILMMVLVVLLIGMGCGLFWTVNLVRFGLPPPTGQDCGDILHRAEIFRESTARADASIQVLACFWHAYQSCQAATMSETYAGIDVGDTTTVTTEQRSDHCAVYGQDQQDINTRIRNTTFLCNRLSKQDDILRLTDCDGVAAFALVPRDITRDSYLCGVVGGTRPYGRPQQVESCFFAAYQQCRGDKMQYDTLENELQVVEVERDFIIDNHCGIAYAHNSYTAACASLQQRADGLHFMGCGADSDIVVPSALPGSST